MWVMAGLAETLPVQQLLLSCFVLQSGGAWPSASLSIYFRVLESQKAWENGAGMIFALKSSY